VLTLPNLSVAAENKTSDIVSSFKNKLKEYMKSYPTPPEISEYVKNCGYRKTYQNIDANYKYDVKATDSLVTPVIAFVEFKLFQYDTECHETYDEALSDNNFKKNSTGIINTTLQRHEYAFRDDIWYITKRKLLMVSPYSRDWLDSKELGNKTIFHESFAK
jgi:hypothetical protein